MNNSIQMIPLYSGSSGNSIFVQFGSTRVLVDVGCSTKSVISALEQVGQNPAHLNAIFITHDHSDHIRGLDVFVRKFNIPVYATQSTWRGIHSAEKKPHAPELDHVVEPGQTFSIGRLEILPFATPHDAKGSVGYRFASSRASMAIATDLGYFSDEVRSALTGCDAILLESNYDYEMLWTGPYPWMLKKRVDGKAGHLCNRDCAEAVKYLYNSGTRHFILGHLSQENNTPSTAHREISAAFELMDLKPDEHYHLYVANRYTPSTPVVLCVAESEDDEPIIPRVRENFRIEDLL